MGRFGENSAEGGQEPDGKASSDYKELLELTIVTLGGCLTNFQIRKPGPDHHARWMSKAIYYLKLSLISKFYPLDEEMSSKIKRMVRFLLTIYVQYWFLSPLSSSAPRNDVELYQKVVMFREKEPKIAFKVISVSLVWSLGHHP